VGIDPRVSALFSIAPNVKTTHTLGLAHQPPSFVGPVPGLQIAGLAGGLQRSIQASSGLEFTFPEEFTASVTVFDQMFLRMTDVAGASRIDEIDFETIDEGAPLAIKPYDERSLGSTVGVEVYVRRSLSRRLTGFFTYTLSRSTRSAGQQRFIARFDRTHVLNFALGYVLGAGWHAGSRFVYYSGNPSEDHYSTRSLHPNRLPDFHRVDLRLQKLWRLAEQSSISLIFEVLNATLSKEVVDQDCDARGCTNDEIGPVTIPSVGVEAQF
jgi:hypothetical protein